MPLQRYFPNTEPEQIAWLNNYKLKIPTHGPTIFNAKGVV